MLRERKILVPTDFSTCAEEATRYAVDLAEELGASVTLFHVYLFPAYPVPMSPSPIATPEMVATFLGSVDDALARTKEAMQEMGGPDISTKATEGEPISEILREARENDYQLIVMGTHGRTGVRHFVLGSVAEQIVRRASCPVLTVREQTLETPNVVEEQRRTP